MRPSHESDGGVFLFSLCERCNNQTGNRYGSDYVRLVRALEPFAVAENANTTKHIQLEDLHPLRVIKQATSMLLSTSKPTDFRNHTPIGAPGRSQRDLEGIELSPPSKAEQLAIFEELRLFVKRRDTNDFSTQVRAYIFVGVGRRIGFRTGIFYRCDLDTKRSYVVIATGMYPLHWIFTIGSDLPDRLLEVTEWSMYSYKQRLEKPIEIPIRWLAGHHPLDFRSPQDLYASNFINSMKFEGYVPTPNTTKEEQLAEALYFARVLGTLTREGYTITTFSSGTFYEFEHLNGWLEHGTPEDALQLLEYRLSWSEFPEE
jgi:hypothetical protein